MSHRRKHRLNAVAARTQRRLDGRPADPSNRARRDRKAYRCPVCPETLHFRESGIRMHFALRHPQVRVR